MVAPQDNTGPGSGGSPLVCLCGGQAWWEALEWPVCLECATSIYDILSPYLEPEDWLALAMEIGRLAIYPESDVPTADLLTFLEEMQRFLEGVRNR